MRHQRPRPTAAEISRLLHPWQVAICAALNRVNQGVGIQLRTAWVVRVIVVIAGLGGLPVAAGSQTLNMSEDLMRLGIAARNLTPDDPSLDARPLFEAAVDYVRAHPAVRVLTLNRGAYYFLTAHPWGYLIIGELVDVTIDLAGSALYFAEPRYNGLQLYYCVRVTLTNFTTDYLTPPYTHVRITSVDAANRRFRYTTLPDWADPVTFAADASPTDIYRLSTLVFRDGRVVPGTSRIPVRAVSSQTIDLFQDGSPWSQPLALGSLLPGDTAVIASRAGSTPVSLWHVDQSVLSRVNVRGAANWAVNVLQSSNTVVERVRVEPRPGGLIGSTADGIHFTQSLRNNHIRDCYVTRTMDDALAMDSIAIAKVLSQPTARVLTVRREEYRRFPNGTLVNFLDVDSADELVGASIVTQDPPDSQSPEFYGTVTLTFDRDLPAGLADDGMVFGDSSMRGAGSTIEDNVVEDIPMGRGIWISGGRGVTVRRNVVRATSSGGVVVSHDTYAFPGPPAHHIDIDSNVLESNLGPSASGSGTPVATAAIVTVSNGPGFSFWPTTPNSDIDVRNNYIADAGRSGVWMGETAGGRVENNLVARWYQQPQLPIWLIHPSQQDQVYGDFTQPVVVRYSSGVSVASNDIRPMSRVSAPVAFSSPFVVAPASGSAAQVTVVPVLPSFEWRASPSSDWVGLTSSPVVRGSGLIDIVVAPNPTPSSRTARVVVAGQSITVLQAGTASILTPGLLALSPPTVNGSQVTLSWTAPVSGLPLNGYLIEASLTPGGSAIVTLPVGGAQTVSVPAPNGVYYVRVRAVNTSGAGPVSNEVVVVVGPGALPSAPQNLTAIAMGNNLTLAWRAPENVATSVVDAYVLEAGRSPGTSDIAIFQTSTPSTLFNTLVPNGVYYVRVRARNSLGIGPPSREVQVVIGLTLPAVPILSATVAAGTVQLSWSDTGGGAPPAGFILQAGTSPGATNAALLTLGPQVRSFTATGVPPGTYFVRVIAQGALGNSLPSNEVIAVVP